MYRIDDICFNKKVDEKFIINKTGLESSFVEYYQNQWKIDIKDKQ